jgi:multicomponent Na+:H+ antiporter subunit A
VTILIAVYAAVGLGMLLAARWLDRLAFAVGAVPLLLTLGYLVIEGQQVLDGRPVTERTTWVAVGDLDLALAFRLDGFAYLMALIIAGIGVAVMAYGASYFRPTTRAARTAGLLVLFAGSMLGVVWADNVGFLYVAWELTSITSWLLIGGGGAKPNERSAALQALLVTASGGLAMLGGLVLLAQAAGTWSLSGILADPPSGTAVGVGLGLILAGVVTKSAQYPAHAWLPSAMVAPTPVSAYLHSATMVKAGIYLAARLAPVFALTGAWRPAVVGIGLFTMLAGGLRALRQQDLKLLLALGTVSQLGFLLVLVGSGYPEATVAGCTLLLAHALFKATLFLVVGIVDHQAGTRHRRELPGFGDGWGMVKLATVLAGASMAGLPPLVGFVAKESAYEPFLHEGASGIVVLIGLVAGSVLTVAYTARFAAAVLSRPAAPTLGVPAPSSGFAAPAAVLAGLSLLAGLGVGALVGPLIDQAGSDLDPRIHGADLALWHGFGAPLALSAITVGCGALVVIWRRKVARIQATLAPQYTAAEAFTATIQGLNVLARRTAGVVQSGSLPVYVAVIIVTAVVVPGTVLALRAPWPELPPVWDTPAQLLLAAVIVTAALAATTATRRIAAVVLLGTVGYGMGLVFVVQGAPDLALTQFAIETLSMVLFVLVLRFLPRRFERRRPGIGMRPRLAITALVTVTVFCFALISSGNRELPPAVSEALVDQSVSEAGGANVVNVTLVDFRGLDTLGEISVLAVAAVGAVALARVGRRPRDVEPQPPTSGEEG